MSRWLISVPVWGERYVEEFCAAALPTLQSAAGVLNMTHAVDVRLIVHTDQPDRIRTATSLVVETRPVPAGARDFDCMSQAHREVLATGMRDDVVVLLTAGAVISGNGLRYCADVLADNSQLHLILCAVPRVLQEGPLPDTADARGLMAWAWDHRHPIVTDCTWPDGRSADLSRTFFEREGTVVTRQCLPHPLAVKIDGRRVNFTPTVDANLMQCFGLSEMHLVQDCKALALIKLSPPDKGHQLVAGTMRARLENYELRIPDPVQRWCLGHKVVLVGEPRDCGDAAFVEKIMSLGG